MKLAPQAEKNTQSLLLALSVIFSVHILVEFNRDYSLLTDELMPADTVDTPAATVNPARVLPPIEEFASIVERPLFMLDRRPYVPGPEASEVEQQPAIQNQTANEQYMLSAVIISDDKRLALLQKQNDNKVYKLGVGESIDGWTVKDIQSKTVALSRGGESRNLELMVKTSPATGSVPARRQRAPRPQNLRNTPGVQPQQIETGGVEQAGVSEPPARAAMRRPEAGPEDIRQPTPEEIEALQRRDGILPSTPPNAQ